MKRVKVRFEYVIRYFDFSTWDHWDGPFEGDRYSAMLYSKGQNCWNGPDRSTKVSVQSHENNIEDSL